MPGTNRQRAWPVLFLFVIASTASAVNVTYQEGVNGYTGTADTFLQQAAPASNNGALDRCEWDSDDPVGTGQDNVALIRFENIFGNGAGQVPPGSQIFSATLSLVVFNSGDAGTVREAAIDWSESTTWNTFGPSPGVQAGDYGASVATVGGSITTQNITVTSSLATWSADPAANRGWIILPTGNGGVEFRSSEYAVNPLLRPKLSISYGTPPPLALVRQPYLQRGTPTSMTICWRTNIASDSIVHYGSNPAMLDQTASSGASVTDHIVTINDLSPATTYYYDVGSTAEVLVGGDADHYFVTSPSAGQPTAFKVWIVGDSGTGDANQAAVRDAMLAATGATPPDLYVHVGDIAYNSGTDQEFTDNFYAPYEAILRHTVCWPTLGNHEGASSDSQTQSGPYYEGYVLPAAAEAGGLASGTEAYYSFNYANAHFICLDSHDTPRTPGSAMLTWLAADLAATDQHWIIAFWHHPPYSKGSHDSDDPFDSSGRLVEMRENVLPILEAGGVDLVLAGHSHIYERSYLVDGAYDTPTTAAGHIVDAGDGRLTGDGAYLKPYGLAAHEGAVYVVAGHGGASLGGTGGHVLMYFDELAFGSCLLTIDGNHLSLQNLRYDGAITDTFDLIKPPPGDIDADGDVDFVDLDLFVAVLLEQETDTGRISRADLDGSGTPDGLDAQPFAAALLGL
ncbi:MAG TPA: metallophosphoesterase [Phycisphaerae bacterium]|nr:metallophosphoesterase [Phycisphaerae bacterium]